MSTINGETLRALIDLTHATSDDVTRQQLQSVHIKDGRAIASDGHIAAWYDDKVGLNGLNCAIPAVALDVFKRAKSCYVELNTNDRTITDGAHTMRLEEYSNAIDHINNSFIKPYNAGETIESKTQTVCTTIAFNPLLLARIGKALGVSKGKGLKLVIKSKNDPIQVYSKDLFSAVLMPMRL
jgi:hypothetical protein